MTVARAEKDRRDLLRQECSFETLGRVVAATRELVSQGVRLRHGETGAEMVLFVGRTGERLVDIQTQGGGKNGIWQLFVSDLGEADVRQIKINHLHNGMMNEDVEEFRVGRLGAGQRREIEERYPRGLAGMRYTDRGSGADMQKMAEVLEAVEVDAELLARAVMHDIQVGGYVLVEEGEVGTERVGTKLQGRLL